MTDKKFTDEEIIKSLECCAKSKTMRDCLKSKCPFSKEWELCSSKEPQMLYLDLINRQKAEIDKLDIELKAMRGAANSYKAEVERLKADNKIYIEANKVIGYQRDQRDKEIDEMQKQIDGLDIRENKIKAEAYKEFAKLLIDKASKGLIHVSDLPDFVKEMVGEEE